MWNKTSSRLASPITWSVLVMAFSLLGAAVIIYCTVWGAALSDDSYYYISSARNLLAGKGFGLVAHFPPALPLLLSAIGIFNIDPLISIRWLNTILFAINIYLVARIVYTLTKSRIFSLMGGFFVLISSTFIMLHSWAMSEALFITFTLTGMAIYSIGQEKDSWFIPLLLGIAWGLAAATRYIGIAWLLAGGTFWLSEKGKDLPIRLRNALVFSLAGIIPLLAWMTRNEILFGRPTSRVFAIHLIPARMWVNMLNTILLWFIPGRLVNGKEMFWLVGGVIVLIVGLAFYLVRKQGKDTGIKVDHPQKPIALLLLSIVSYLLILAISRSFFDQRIPMDERLLSPILILGVLVILWGFSKLQDKNKWLGIIIIAGFSLLVLVTNLTRSIQMVQSYHEVGRGYASARDHISETYAYLRNRPDIPIYSNAFAAIYFWTGRVTYPLPDPWEIPAMKAEMQKTGAYLVIFDSIPVELYGTTQADLTQGLVEQIRLSEATIYRSP
jgi:hypothetical protein